MFLINSTWLYAWAYGFQCARVRRHRAHTSYTAHIVDDEVDNNNKNTHIVSIAVVFDAYEHKFI